MKVQPEIRIETVADMRAGPEIEIAKDESEDRNSDKAREPNAEIRTETEADTGQRTDGCVNENAHWCQ